MRAPNRPLPPRAPFAADAASLFAKYLLAGIGSFVTDFSVFALLTSRADLSPLGAHAISRPLGGLTCFVLNRRYTFRSTAALPPELARFWCVFAASLGLTAGLLALFCGPLGLAPLLGKALAETIAVVFNFLSLRHWTFRRNEAT